MTPMIEIEKLKDGVYEKVMSRRFAEVLREALAEDQVRAEEEDVDAEEAVGYLSSYLQRVIRLCLKDIADRDEENCVDHQLALTNELIASLAKKTEELGGGQEVANAPFLLRSLEHKKNTLLPRRWERPATSLTRSFLFTNSKKDVSMVHELTKEIASSDRIDFLISFIRFSGLQLLLPALRLFTARGGHLRIVTTTYMGATDPKAIEVLASERNQTARQIIHVLSGKRLLDGLHRLIESFPRCHRRRDGVEYESDGAGPAAHHR